MIKRKRTAHDPEKMAEAIGAISSKRMSTSEASRFFDIPYSTLNDKILGKSPLVKAPTTLLTPEEEEKLAEWLWALKERGLAKTPEDVMLKAKSILDLRSASSRSKTSVPTTSWFYRFMSRHPHLTTRKKRATGRDAILDPPPDPQAHPGSDIVPDLPSSHTGPDDIPDSPLQQVHPGPDAITDPSPSSLDHPPFTTQQLVAMKDMCLFVIDDLGRNQCLDYFRMMESNTPITGDSKFDKFLNLMQAMVQSCSTSITKEEDPFMATWTIEDVLSLSDTSNTKAPSGRKRPTVPSSSLHVRKKSDKNKRKKAEKSVVKIEIEGV